MNKKDLVKAANIGFPDAELMVNQMLLAMNIAFIKKETVRIPYFGTFKPCNRKLPQFKDGLNTIMFKPCKEMIKRMNRKEQSNG